MTGTGTQAGPYIPTTLTEFITAVGTAGAYVQLTQDINAAEDPAYTGEIETLIWAAQDFDGNGFEIVGVTVSGQQMIYHSIDNTEARNFRLRDWDFKPINATPAIFCGRKINANTFRNVLASVKYDNAYFPMLAFCDNMVCHDSAFHITYTGAGSNSAKSSFFDYNVKMFGCTVVFENAPLVCDYLSTSACEFVHCAIIFKSACAYANMSFLGQNSTLTYSYIAVLDKIDAPLYNTGSALIINSLFACADGQEVSGSIARVATLDQMKDKAWLSSVGFLP